MQVTTGRAFDRLVNFTDAVVAVAITLLVLSIVDIRGTATETTVWQVIADNASQVIAFGFTFVVVAAMWSVHNRLFNRLRGFDGVIFRLNLVWLFGVVLLPWPSALYGEGLQGHAMEWSGGQGFGGTGLFYWGTLAVISTMTGLMSRHIRRHPELLDPESGTAARHPMRGFAFAIAFLVYGITSVVFPDAMVWLPWTLVPLAIWFGRTERAMNQTTNETMNQPAAGPSADPQAEKEQ